MFKALTPFLCGFSFLGIAQTPVPQIDLQVSFAMPFNETAVSDASAVSSLFSIGFGGGFSMPISENWPIRVGMNLRYMWLGSESKDFYFEDSEGDTYNLESKVRGAMTPLHLTLRIDPMDYIDFPVLPYVGAFAGIRFFNTNNKITIDYENGSEPDEDNNREVSVSSSYGFELGMHIKVSKGFLLDFKYEHAYGGWAKYLDLSSIEIDNSGRAQYDRLETRTDVAIYTIGLTVLLE